MFEDTREIVNAEAEPIEVYFEPWGTMRPLAPGAAFEVSTTSEVDGALQVVSEAGRIAVCAWPGCTMSVYQAGVLVENFSVRVPILSRGMPSRDFISTMLGGAGTSKLALEREGMLLDAGDRQAAPAAGSTRRPRRWKCWLKGAAILGLLIFAVISLAIRDHVRTLQSLRRVPETNAFVMDYYVDYHIDEIRRRGMDVDNIEDSLIETLFPDFIKPIATRIKRSYVPKQTTTTTSGAHHCSTLAIRANDGSVFFGRNFDWHHDAYLILRVHDGRGVASISVLDLAYLNLNRPDLDQTSLFQRIPLLFAPYYLMDGMNRHGVAVADMAAEARPPVVPDKPAIIQPTLMRLILDRAKDADEAVNLVREFNVHFVDVPEHLMIADASGRFRVIEYINGKTGVTSPDRPWMICTNHILAGKSETENDASCPRYRLGSDMAEDLEGRVDFAGSIRITKAMAVDGLTMWSSIYDLTSGKACIHYQADPRNEHYDAMKVLGGEK
jgi:hypothetical protein